MWWLIGLLVAPPSEPGSVAIQQPEAAVVWAFEWEAPTECPGRDDVIAAIREYLPELDDPPITPARADLRIAASVSSEGRTWTAALRTSGREGNVERSFSAPSCTELADAVALITAVALDPVLVARRTQVIDDEPELVESIEPPKPSEVPESPEPEAIVETEVPEPESDPLRGLVLTESADSAPLERDVDLGIGVQGFGAWGPTAAGFGGLAGSFAVFAGRWRWQLDGGWWAPRVQTLDDGRSGRIQGWWLGTRGCVVPRVGAVELPLCPGIEAGQAIARGIAPTTNVRGARQPWVAIVVSPGLRWAFVDRVALTLDAALLVSLVRGRFLIGDEPIASLTPVGFRGSLGLEVRF
jgi:hypothetical protein